MYQRKIIHEMGIYRWNWTQNLKKKPILKYDNYLFMQKYNVQQ